MTTKKFEVGKRYRGKLNNQTLVECIFVTPEGTAVLSYLGDTSKCFKKEHFANLVERDFWEEYTEPVKRWINIYKWTAGHYETGSTTYTDPAKASDCGLRASTNSYRYVKTIEIEI